MALKYKVRKTIGDRKYNNIYITKLINNLMLNGKKLKMEQIVYKILEEGAEKYKIEVNEFFSQILKNITPEKKVMPKRVGGATYLVPYVVDAVKGPLLGLKLLVKVARSTAWTKGTSIENVLRSILFDAYNNAGEAVAETKKLTNLAKANEAFAHFRW